MPPKRRARWHPNRPLISLLAALGGAALLYVLVSIGIHWDGKYQVKDLLVPRLLDLFVVAWFFWFGSSIGSFLNVVAWRMPRGRSINGHSACPFCANRIRTYDNVPVFGWIKLRGRCRACRLPIAARYPTVEALVGISIMLVGVLGLYSGGENLPMDDGHSHATGPLRMPRISTELIALNAYHILILTGTWAFALVRVDGLRLPGSLVKFSLATAILPMLAWPALQQVPWQLRSTPDWDNGSHLVALFYVLTAIVAACVLARMIARYVCPAADPKLDPLGKDTARLIDLICILSLPGIVLGWHALIAICMVSILVAMGLRKGFPNRNGFEWLMASVPGVMTLHLAFWRPLAQWTLWPAPNHAPWVFLVWLTGVLVFSAGLRNVEPQACHEVPLDETMDD